MSPDCIEASTKSIPLVNRHGEIVDYAFVDIEDFDFLSQVGWYRSNGYAKNDRLGLMHRAVMARKSQSKSKLAVDHIDRSKLNNRRVNLRWATDQVNALNRPLRKDNSAGYHGVFYNQDTNTFTAFTDLNKRRQYLGRFQTAREAAIARDLYVKDKPESVFMSLNVLEPTVDEVQKVQEHQRNPKKIKGTSQFLGVSCDYRKKTKLWTVHIVRKGKVLYHAVFDHELEAAKAYNDKAVELFGGAAKLNSLQ